jgi:hypothetical protein
MSATSLDLSQIKTDALSAASTFRTLIGLGTGDTPTFSSLTLGTSGVFVGGTNLIEQRNSTNAQRFNLYGTFTDASNFRRMFLSSTTAGAFTIGVEGAGTGASGNTLAIGNQLLFGDGTNSVPSISFSNDTDTGIYRQTNAINFAVNGVLRQQFQTDGSIAIIGTSPFLFASGTGNFTIQSAVGSINLIASSIGVSPSTLTGSSATSALDIAQTWNTTGTPTLIKANVTDTASNANSLLMDLRTGGVSRFRVTKDGWVRTPYLQLYSVPKIAAENVLTQAIVYVGYAHSLRLGVNEVPRVEVDPISGLGIGVAAGGGMNNGVWLINDAAQTLAQRNAGNAQTFRIYNTFTDASNYERGKLEWSSNVFRIGTEKAGTGSARALELQTDGTTRLTIGTAGLFTIADALDIAVGTTTGTKIGTATTQKLGFFNATPVVQPTAVADATDAASVITQLNALLSRMRTLGLIAT